MSFSFSVVAAVSYSGASALQWPHHGAKTVVVSVVHLEYYKGERNGSLLTLCENKVVVLDELLEVLGLQLDDI